MVACGSDTDDETQILPLESVEPPAPANPALCSTLDYGHEQSAAEHYLFFDDDQQAAEFIRARRPAFSEISSDPRLARLMTEIHAGFVLAFPKEMQGLDVPPPIAIVDDPAPNAYALAGVAGGADGTERINPWVFVVNRPLLDLGATDTELRGLFAHELAHLVLRNGDTAVRARLAQRAYLVDGSEDWVFGAVQPGDPELQAHIAEILAYQGRVGSLPELALNAVVGGPKYTDLIRTTLEGNPECAETAAQLQELNTLQRELLPDASIGLVEPAPATETQRAELDRLTQSILDGLVSCGGEDTLSLAFLQALLAGLPPDAVAEDHSRHAELVDLMLDTELAIDAEFPEATLMARIAQVVPRLSVVLLALRADPNFPIDAIRVYDLEEDADDASARVLRAIGDDPRGVALFLLNRLMTAEQKQECEDAIAAGEGVDYGRLRDQHLPYCWRFQHLSQLAESLEQCSELPTSDLVQAG